MAAAVQRGRIAGWKAIPIPVTVLESQRTFGTEAPRHPACSPGETRSPGNLHFLDWKTARLRKNPRPRCCCCLRSHPPGCQMRSRQDWTKCLVVGSGNTQVRTSSKGKHRAVRPVNVRL